MRKKIIIGFLILLIIIPLFYWLNSFGIIANSDSQHGYNSFYFLNNEMFSWKDYHNGGMYLPFPLVPLLVLGSFFNLFGLALSSAAVTILLLVALWFSFYRLIVFILKAESFLNKLLIFIISSFIISNEIIKNYLICNNTVIWAELFTILSVYFYLKYYYEANNKFLFFSLICLSSTLIMFHSLILTTFFIVFYSVGDILWCRSDKDQKDKKGFQKVVVFLILLLALNSYFLINNFGDFVKSNSSILKNYEVNKALTDQILRYVDEHYTNWGFNFILSRDVFFSRYPLFFKSVLVVDYFLILFLSLAAFFALKNKQENKEIIKRILIFFVIYITMLFLAFGPKGPFGFFNFLWNHVPGFKLFRDFSKFHWIILILLPIFCAYSVISFLSLITNHNYYKQLKITTIVVVLVLFLIPLYSTCYLLKYSKPFKIPDGYFNINYYLNEKKTDSAAMVAPIISWMQKYTWSNHNYDMQDPFSTKFLYKPVYVNAVLYEEGYNDKLNKEMIGDLIGNNPDFYKLANLRNLVYLIIRNDLDPEYIKVRKQYLQLGEQLDTPKLLSVANRSSQLTFLDKFSDLYLYQIKNNLRNQHFYSARYVKTTRESLEEFSKVISNFDYQSNAAIYFADQNKDSLAAYNHLNTLAATTILTPTLEFKKINPIKYRIIVHRAQGEFPLVFSENYHEGWKIYLGDKENIDIDPARLTDYKILDGNKNDQASSKEVEEFISQGLISNLGNGKDKEIKKHKWEDNREKLAYIERYKIDFISKIFQGTIQNDNLADGPFYETWFEQPIENNANHLMANGYANSWVIDTSKVCGNDNVQCIKNADGSYDFEMVVEFWPQRLFYVGLAISGITLLACLGYLGYDWQRRRPRSTAVSKRV